MEGTDMGGTGAITGAIDHIMEDTGAKEGSFEKLPNSPQFVI